MGPVIVIHASCEVHGVTMASSVMTDELVLKKATKSCMRNVVSRFQTFLMNFLKVFRIDLFRTVLCSVQETRTTATGPPPFLSTMVIGPVMDTSRYKICALRSTIHYRNSILREPRPQKPDPWPRNKNNNRLEHWYLIKVRGYSY